MAEKLSLKLILSSNKKDGTVSLEFTSLGDDLSNQFIDLFPKTYQHGKIQMMTDKSALTLFVYDKSKLEKERVVQYKETFRELNPEAIILLEQAIASKTKSSSFVISKKNPPSFVLWFSQFEQKTVEV